jgi:hypothetical protein
LDFLFFRKPGVDECATKLSELKKDILTGRWLYQAEEGRRAGLEQLLELLDEPIINVISPSAREQRLDHERPMLKGESVLTERMSLQLDEHLAGLLVDSHCGIIDRECFSFQRLLKRIKKAFSPSLILKKENDHRTICHTPIPP